MSRQGWKCFVNDHWGLYNGMVLGNKDWYCEGNVRADLSCRKAQVPWDLGLCSCAYVISTEATIVSWASPSSLPYRISTGWLK